MKHERTIGETNEATMTGNKDFDLLQTQGDPLEKLICGDFEELSPVMFPYASVWAKHIYPRRVGDGSEVVSEWLPFAGCHYTALIRLHHALLAKRQVLEICTASAKEHEVGNRSEDYRRVLQLHAACATFWDNLGAAIDNFVHSRAEAKNALGAAKEKRKEKGKCPECGSDLKAAPKFVARTLSQTENPKLYYAFERRHQFIHSILVPHKIDGGLIVFNMKHYDDAATDWSREVEVLENIDTQISRDWNEVLHEFGNTWAEFSSWLQSNDQGRPQPTTEIPFNASSTPLSGSNATPAPLVPASKANSVQIDPPISGFGTIQPKRR